MISTYSILARKPEGRGDLGIDRRIENRVLIY
jgi:hypothetical protein